MKKLILSINAVIIITWLFSAPLFAGDINLFAAASLKDVLNELTDTYTKSHPHVKFKKNYGGSGLLAKQIMNGAPADIFISASISWVDYLKTAKNIDEKSREVFAYNELVFVGRESQNVKSLQDLIRLEKIAVGSPKSVPAGEYAMEAIKKAGLEKQLQRKWVMTKDVRECLLYAIRGDVDGAFVYKTDVYQGIENVKMLFTVPQEYYPQVVYPMILTREGAQKSDAVDFYTVLRSKEAKEVLRKYGFIIR